MFAKRMQNSEFSDRSKYKLFCGRTVQNFLIVQSIKRRQKIMANEPSLNKKTSLYNKIASILEESRKFVATTVNKIGRLEEQHENVRAEYGKETLKNLSIKLTANYGKEFFQNAAILSCLLYKNSADTFCEILFKLFPLSFFNEN